jgi:hypothetical protein
MTIRKIKVFAALCFSFPCIAQASSTDYSEIGYDDGPIVCEMPPRCENPCYRFVPEARRYSGIDILMLDDESFAQEDKYQEDKYTDSREISDDLLGNTSHQSQSTECFDQAESDILSGKIAEYKEASEEAITNAYEIMSTGEALTPLMFLRLCVAYAVLDDKQKSDAMFDSAKRILCATETGKKQFESLRSLATSTIRKDQTEGYISEATAAYIVSTFYAR